MGAPTRMQIGRVVAAAALVAAALVPAAWWPLHHTALHLARASLAVGAGYLLSSALEHRLATAAWSRDMARASLIRLIIRLGLLVLVAVSVLGALGVDLTQITYGGAVVTVVIGLAGQTLFGNVLAGMVLVIWRPFEIGDDISVVSSQMPLFPPTLPHETVPSANRVTVHDVNLLHTICVGEDGERTMIPNALMLQAVVRNRSHTQAQRLRVMAEVARDVDGIELWERLAGLGARLMAQGLPIQGTPAIHLVGLTATANTFVVEVWVTAPRRTEDVRSAILLAVAAILAEMRSAAP